jgi:lipopolysaccharide transport system ATP-binding protein
MLSDGPVRLAIRVRHLAKCYHVFESPQDRLRQSLFPRLRRLVGAPQKQYAREFRALRDVSFEVLKGETVGIIGRNGSGKSTLLQIICDTLTPTSGDVETHGRIAALLELGSGFNPEFTGRENVFLNAALLGLTREQTRARFDDIATFADIGDFIEQPVKTYSSGMVLRLAFAVIAHVDADILVIDEALSVGDAFFVQKCMRFLRGFMRHGTIIFVSHDLGAVVNLCQKAIWLDGGAVKAVGSPKDIAAAYLAELVELQQGASEVSTRTAAAKTDRVDVGNVERREGVDQRLRFLNNSSLRNDIELFRFDPGAACFGLGGMGVVQVELQDSGGQLLSWCVGGEEVILRIRCIAHQPVVSPIVGFWVKDRLGQTLFGENTYLSNMGSPLELKAGDQFEGVFAFRMPILPVGDYCFGVAVAEGTQQEHVQHQWIHDALFFKSYSTSVSTGLVGIPIDQIELRIIRD